MLCRLGGGGLVGISWWLWLEVCGCLEVWREVVVVLGLGAFKVTYCVPRSGVGTLFLLVTGVVFITLLLELKMTLEG